MTQLYIDVRDSFVPASSEPSPFADAHRFTGYFLPPTDPTLQPKWREEGHPPKSEGMVSTICDDPPLLNWIYVDKLTNEVKYGTRAECEGHLQGPWDVTKGDRRGVTFEGWEGFVAVEERGFPPESDDEDLLELTEQEKMKQPKLWALYFDVHDDGLRSGNRAGDPPGRRRILEIELSRREKKKTRGVAIEERIDRIEKREEMEEKEEQKRREREREDGRSWVHDVSADVESETTSNVKERVEGGKNGHKVSGRDQEEGSKDSAGLEDDLAHLKFQEEVED